MALRSIQESEWVELNYTFENPELTARIRELGEALRTAKINAREMNENDPYEIRCGALGPLDVYSPDEGSGIVIFFRDVKRGLPRLKAVLWANNRRVDEKLDEKAVFTAETQSLSLKRT